MENFLFHESNLYGKCLDVKKNAYRRIHKDFLLFKEWNYDPYKQSQQQVTGTSYEDIRLKSELLDEYLRDVERFIKIQKMTNRVGITSQSKFRSSVLEEFCGFLLKDIPEINHLDLDFFNTGIFAGIELNRTGVATIKTKNVDCCLGKRFSFAINNKPGQIIVPVIAIECKTYIDKTMLSGTQFTASKMKQVSPGVKIYCICEWNDIGINEIPSKGTTPLDQIFVVRGKEGIPINPGAVFEIFTEVKTALENISRIPKHLEVGGILPD